MSEQEPCQRSIISPSLTAGFDGSMGSKAGNIGFSEEQAITAKSTGGGIASYAVDCRNGIENECVNGTLQAKNQGSSLNLNNVVRVSSYSTREETGGGEISPTITGGHQDRITDYTAIVVEIHENIYGEPIRGLPCDGNGK